MSITVNWGREHLHLTLPLRETKVGYICRSLAEYTQNHLQRDTPGYYWLGDKKLECLPPAQ